MGCLCAQALVCVDVLMANSSVVTAECKEKGVQTYYVGAIYPCYSVRFGHFASDNLGHHFRHSFERLRICSPFVPVELY